METLKSIRERVWQRRAQSLRQRRVLYHVLFVLTPGTFFALHFALCDAHGPPGHMTWQLWVLVILWVVTVAGELVLFSDVHLKSTLFIVSSVCVNAASIAYLVASLGPDVRDGCGVTHAANITLAQIPEYRHSELFSFADGVVCPAYNASVHDEDTGDIHVVAPLVRRVFYKHNQSHVGLPQCPSCTSNFVLPALRAQSAAHFPMAWVFFDAESSSVSYGDAPGSWRSCEAGQGPNAYSSTYNLLAVDAVLARYNLTVPSTLRSQIVFVKWQYADSWLADHARARQYFIGLAVVVTMCKCVALLLAARSIAVASGHRISRELCFNVKKTVRRQAERRQRQKESIQLE